MSTLKDLREQFSTPPEDVKKAEELESLKLRLASLEKEKTQVEILNDFGESTGVKFQELLKGVESDIEKLKDEISNLEGNGLREVGIGVSLSFEPNGLKRLNEIADRMRNALKGAGTSMAGFGKAMRDLAEKCKLTSVEMEYIRAQIAPVPDLRREIGGRWVMRLPDHPHCRTELEPVELVGSGEAISKEDIDKFFKSLPLKYRAPHMSPKDSETGKILTKLVKLRTTEEMLAAGIERAKNARHRFTLDLLTEQIRQVANDRDQLEWELSKIAHEVPEPEIKGRVADLKRELKKMEYQMRNLSVSMNQAVNNDDEMYGGHLNTIIADIERKKIVIQDQLRRLEAQGEDEVSFKGILGDW